MKEEIEKNIRQTAFLCLTVKRAVFDSLRPKKKTVYLQLHIVPSMCDSVVILFTHFPSTCFSCLLHLVLPFIHFPGCLTTHRYIRGKQRMSCVCQCISGSTGLVDAYHVTTTSSLSLSLCSHTSCLIFYCTLSYKQMCCRCIAFWSITATVFPLMSNNEKFSKRITMVEHLNSLIHAGQKEGSTTENQDMKGLWQRVHWTGQDPIISD